MGTKTTEPQEPHRTDVRKLCLKHGYILVLDALADEFRDESRKLDGDGNDLLAAHHDALACILDGARTLFFSPRDARSALVSEAAEGDPGEGGEPRFRPGDQVEIYPDWRAGRILDSAMWRGEQWVYRVQMHVGLGQPNRTEIATEGHIRKREL